MKTKWKTALTLSSALRTLCSVVLWTALVCAIGLFVVGGAFFDALGVDLTLKGEEWAVYPFLAFIALALVASLVRAVAARVRTKALHKTKPATPHDLRGFHLSALRRHRTGHAGLDTALERGLVARAAVGHLEYGRPPRLDLPLDWTSETLQELEDALTYVQGDVQRAAVAGDSRLKYEAKAWEQAIAHALRIGYALRSGLHRKADEPVLWVVRLVKGGVDVPGEALTLEDAVPPLARYDKDERPTLELRLHTNLLGYTSAALFHARCPDLSEVGTEDEEANGEGYDDEQEAAVDDEVVVVDVAPMPHWVSFKLDINSAGSGRFSYDAETDTINVTADPLSTPAPPTTGEWTVSNPDEDHPSAGPDDDAPTPTPTPSAPEDPSLTPGAEVEREEATRDAVPF